MGTKILIKKGIRRQRMTLMGTFILFVLISLAAVLAVTVSLQSESRVQSEMNRLRFGDSTVWVSGNLNLPALTQEISASDEVETVYAQPLIFAGYTISGTHSDNEGQLLAFTPEQYDYRVLKNDLSGYQQAAEIRTGEIYISPAMQSSYDVKIGDTVSFSLSRTGEKAEYVVAGYFEDPFMGSSMIDMKSFLISQTDFDALTERLAGADPFNLTARSGAMLHLFSSEQADTAAQLENALEKQAALGTSIQFSYSRSSMLGFMMLLQNIFIGFLCAFAAILTIVSLFVIAHNISASMELERRDMAALKMMGCTSTKLRIVQLAQYAIAVAGGLLGGFLLSVLVVPPMMDTMISSTGMRIPAQIPVMICLAALIGMLVLLAAFVWLRTAKIISITPLQALLQESVTADNAPRTPLTRQHLSFDLALRQLFSGRKKYGGICCVAVVLVLFVSVIGRMNLWLGANGEGLMDAFSVAAHDLGVQAMGADTDMAAIESKISEYAAIEDTYELAMQSVTVNGTAYTANILDEPEWFHILSGSTCQAADEIVVTKFVAEDLGVQIGDEISVQRDGSTSQYRITGIYQCANEMGANIGMTKEGFARIGNVEDYIWCKHYILSDSSYNEKIMRELQQLYPTEIDVHTNSWSGLSGIVQTMHLLTVMMLGIVTILVLITITLSAGKILTAEQRDLAVFRAIGFSANRLRQTFALRIALVVMMGSVLGTLLACVFADTLIGRLLSGFGIGSFHSDTGASIFIPGILITLLFAIFALLASRRIRRLELKNLLTE